MCDLYFKKNRYVVSGERKRVCVCCIHVEELTSICIGKINKTLTSFPSAYLQESKE